jgi:hypothetical protein
MKAPRRHGTEQIVISLSDWALAGAIDRRGGGDGSQHRDHADQCAPGIVGVGRLGGASEVGAELGVSGQELTDDAEFLSRAAGILEATLIERRGPSSELIEE